MQFTRREVADHCGVSQGVIERWEHGESIPSVQQFKRLVGMKGMRRVGKTPPEWGWAAEPVVDGSGAWEAHKQKHTDLIRELEQQDPVPRPPPQSFGEGLRRIREENGVSQEALAELLDIEQASVSQWERDGANPVRDNLHKLFQVLPELEMAISVGAVRLPESRDIDKPVGPSGKKFPRASSVDTMLEIAFEQSDAEVAREPQRLKPRWTRRDIPAEMDEIDRLADEIGDPTMPEEPAKVTASDPVPTERTPVISQISTAIELSAAYARARVRTLKARRVAQAAMEALTNAQTDLKNAEDEEREALALLDIAIAEEADAP